MFRKRDLILLASVAAAACAGLLWPAPMSRFEPALGPSLMIILFLAFLNIYPRDVWSALRSYAGRLTLLVLIKLILLPALVYVLALWLAPEYALALLMLSATATGVVAPFFSAQVGGSAPLALVVVVVTSLLLPFTLPGMAKLLAHQVIDFDLVGLSLFLMVMIFVPLLAGGLCRRLVPKAARWLNGRSFPISVVLFSVINLGTFGRYAPYLQANPQHILVGGLLTLILGGLMPLVGAALLWSTPRTDRITAAGAMGWINNVLIIVLGAELQNPLISVMAALYMIPYYGLYAVMSAQAKACSSLDSPGQGQKESGRIGWRGHP